MKKYNVAVVGATGLVGSTFLKVLKEYDFPKRLIINNQPDLLWKILGK